MLIAPDLGYGGAERSFAALSVWLATECDVYPVVFNKENDQVHPTSVPILSLDVPTAATLLGKVRSLIQRIYRLKRLKRSLRIDVSISFLEGADYLNLLSTMGEVVIFSVRGSKRYDLRISASLGWFRHKILIPLFYRRADRLVCVSEGLRREMITDYGIPADKVVTIHNAYDSGSLREMAKAPLDPILSTWFQRFETLIAVGRMSPEKGFLQLLDVFKRLSDHRADVRLVFIGDGELEEEMVKRCNRHNLRYAYFSNKEEIHSETRVLFLGYQKNPYAYIGRSKLFVLSSLTEGFPNALAEAMAVGTPVAAANCPYGVMEILQGDDGPCGLMLPPFDFHRREDEERIYSSWTQGLSQLLDDRDALARYARLGMNRISQLSYETTLRQWMEAIA